MDKIALNTESYLISGKENKRFYPFLELEFNENVIYENDTPKYYLIFSDNLKSAHGIGDWIMADLKKNGHNLRELIIELGNGLNLKWDIFSSKTGMEVENSYQTEQIELEILTDKTIERIKTTPQQRV
ncbi:hypothetical protein [Psychroserpens ponticola]|uniref:Uncharacterized protein n=1 Tax=Psychroserpens ponticola TaxID=2932268 RepID=A0ABY7S3W6_9FLAO|nr:hypothetical protein [Psychroserpens ponticola]WCO03591.1 hypothetical protein MUN68_008790 [Psychroserpens ponticola]